jgi:hypothetical protein
LEGVENELDSEETVESAEENNDVVAEGTTENNEEVVENAEENAEIVDSAE